jgi:preprotein translocase subunit SecG
MPYTYLVVFLLLIVTVIAVIVKQKSRRRNAETPDGSTIQKKHGFLKFLFITISIAAIIFSAIKIIDCATNKTNNDGATQPFSRTARNSDIYLKEKELSFNPIGMKYLLISNVDISNLKIRVSIFNSSKTIKSDKTFYIGDTKSAVEENFVYSISDLNITFPTLNDWLTNDFYWDYDVVGGTVSYFA